MAGTVVRLDNGEPLKKATVTLWYHDDSEKSAYAITDDQGKFFFDNLETGSYGLNVTRNGYVQMSE